MSTPESIDRFLSQALSSEIEEKHTAVEPTEAKDMIVADERFNLTARNLSKTKEIYEHIELIHKLNELTSQSSIAQTHFMLQLCASIYKNTHSKARSMSIEVTPQIEDLIKLIMIQGIHDTFHILCEVLKSEQLPVYNRKLNKLLTQIKDECETYHAKPQNRSILSSINKHIDIFIEKLNEIVEYWHRGHILHRSTSKTINNIKTCLIKIRHCIDFLKHDNNNGHQLICLYCAEINSSNQHNGSNTKIWPVSKPVKKLVELIVFHGISDTKQLLNHKFIDLEYPDLLTLNTTLRTNLDAIKASISEAKPSLEIPGDIITQCLSDIDALLIPSLFKDITRYTVKLQKKTNESIDVFISQLFNIYPQSIFEKALTQAIASKQQPQIAILIAILKRTRISAQYLCKLLIQGTQGSVARDQLDIPRTVSNVAWVCASFPHLIKHVNPVITELELELDIEPNPYLPVKTWIAYTFQKDNLQINSIIYFLILGESCQTSELLNQVFFDLLGKQTYKSKDFKNYQFFAQTIWVKIKPIAQCITDEVLLNLIYQCMPFLSSKKRLSKQVQQDLENEFLKLYIRILIKTNQGIGWQERNFDILKEICNFCESKIKSIEPYLLQKAGKHEKYNEYVQLEHYAQNLLKKINNNINLMIDKKEKEKDDECAALLKMFRKKFDTEDIEYIDDETQLQYITRVLKEELQYFRTIMLIIRCTSQANHIQHAQEYELTCQDIAQHIKQPKIQIDLRNTPTNELKGGDKAPPTKKASKLSSGFKALFFSEKPRKSQTPQLSTSKDNYKPRSTARLS